MSRHTPHNAYHEITLGGIAAESVRRTGVQTAHARARVLQSYC